ncbi:IclR family transcriptional regulator [Brevundimonas sp.]|uniref:IclR family transcriptional regulator n=1 Tax=Brevundimonas sp. TaxID=1871086 RepID=UPI003782DD89
MADEIDKGESGGPRAMGRVLALLELLARTPVGLPLADISVALGVPKSTLLNSLRPLVVDDFLVVEGVLYRLGPRAFRLAATIGSAYDLPRMVRGYLRALAEETQESVCLAVLDQEMRRFVYIDVIESSRPVRYAMRLGMSGPLYSTAAGRVLLAYQTPDYQDDYIAKAKLVALTDRTNTDRDVLRRQLEEVRQTGLWVSLGESVEDSAAVAAPVFGPDGAILAAISLGAPSDRLVANREALTAAVVKTAAHASGGMAAV